MARTLGELAAQFDCELIGDPSVTVSRVATLSNAGPGDLSFFANKIYRDELRKTAATAVVASGGEAEDCPAAVLVASDPYLTYARIATLLHPTPAVAAGIHTSAHVAESATLADGVEISPLFFWCKSGFLLI